MFEKRVLGNENKMLSKDFFYFLFFIFFYLGLSKSLPAQVFLFICFVLFCFVFFYALAKT